MAQTTVLVEQAPNGNWAATAPELGLIAVQEQKEEAETDLELILDPTLKFIQEKDIPVVKTDIEPYDAKHGMIAERYASLSEVQTCLLTGFRTIDNVLATKAADAGGVITPRTKSIRFWDGFFLYDLEPAQKLAFSFIVDRAGDKYHIAFRLKADPMVLRKVAEALFAIDFESYARREANIF